MRRHRLRPKHVAAGMAFLLVAAITFSVADLGVAAREEPAPPAALARVAAKNDAAATIAAARMKAESEAQAAATDEQLRAAEARGRADADATIAGLDGAE